MNLKYFNIPPPNIEEPISEIFDTSPGQGLVLCAYGKYNLEDINTTNCNINIVDIQYTDKFTYLYITNFEVTDPVFDYMDGFSPNLNKRLHIGHFSNLVYASAFKNMGICTKSIAIYGDTLSGTDLDNTEYNKFMYSINDEYFASKQIVDTESNPSLLVDGIGDYINTKCFKLSTEDNSSEINDTLVGIKSDGSTSYFYQDVALVQKLNGSTLYLTGKEQSNHFKQLKSVIGLEDYSTNINHIGLGLISLQGEKMSSRKGNVIYMDDLLAMVNEEFDNTELAYNVLAGFILMSNPTKDLKINLDSITGNETIFIKPKRQKFFTGLLVQSPKDLVAKAIQGEDYGIWCSEPIKLQSEYRAFVRYGKILDVRRYKGDFKIHPNYSVIERCVIDYKNSPAAYGIDFGVTESGRTVLIEVNDGFALGDYGLFYLDYAKLVYTRWAELVSCKDYFNF